MRVLIHVGYPKTATTLLQKQVFPHHPEIAFFGKYNSSLTSQMITTRMCDYDPDATRARFLDEAAKQQKETVVISRERFVGNPLLSAQEGDILAHRISLTFPEAEIILFVRSQVEMIESLYAEMVVGGGTAACTNVRNLLRTSDFADAKIGWNPEYLMYDKTIGYFDRLFGRKNVNVFVFEKLRSDFQAFISSFFDVMNLAPIEVDSQVSRARSSSWKYHFLRMANQLRRGQLNPGRGTLSPRADKLMRTLSSGIDHLQHVLGLDSKAKCVDAELAREIESVYKESNQRLADRIQQPLTEWGYAL